MLRIVIPIAVVFYSLPVLFAQNTVEQWEARFDRLDANNDGLLTRDELDSNEGEISLFERFLKLHDTDGDGQLKKAEFLKPFERQEQDEAERPEARQRPPRQQGMDAASVFARLDNNQDGKLEIDELPGLFREKLAPTFKSLGKDSLTLEEFTPAYRVFAEPRQRPGLPSPDAFFEHFDQNKDGKVTVDEVPEQFQPTLRQMFDQLETEFITKDGYTQIYELLVERSQQDDAQQGSEGRPADRPETAGRDDRGRPDFRGRPSGGVGERPGSLFFGMLDSDRDGKLSGGELSRAPQLLARLDRNEDGLLDPSEIFGNGRSRRDNGDRFGPPGRRRPERAQQTDDRPERPQRPALADEPQEPQEPSVTAGTTKPETAPPRTSRTSIQEASNAEFADRLFVRYDADRDGKLSREEAPARLRRSFGRLDLDADGSVSKEELTKSLGGDSR